MIYFAFDGIESNKQLAGMRCYLASQCKAYSSLSGGRPVNHGGLNHERGAGSVGAARQGNFHFPGVAAADHFEFGPEYS